MGFGTRALFEPQRSLAGSASTGIYAAVGTALAHQARIMIFQNLTDGDVQVSLDGVNDHFPLAAGALFVLDVCSDKVQDDGFFIAKGTVIYAKDGTAAPTEGNFYVSVIYAKGDNE